MKVGQRGGGGADGSHPWSGAGYDAWFETPWGRYASAVEHAAVLAAAAPLEGRRLLDVGCGTGRLLALAARARAEVVGCDAEASMLDVAAGRAAGRLVRADAGELPLVASSFDLVVALAVLEFVPRPDAVMAELARVTRRGGRVLVGALNPRSAWGLAQAGRFRRPPWTGARFLRRQDLRALARPHGPAEVHGHLFAPGPCPGPHALAAAVEGLGRLVPWWGAFQLMVLEPS